MPARLSNFSLHGWHGHKSVRMHVSGGRSVVICDRDGRSRRLIYGVEWVLTGGGVDRSTLSLCCLYLPGEARGLMDLMLLLLCILIILVNTLLQRNKFANSSINLGEAG